MFKIFLLISLVASAYCLDIANGVFRLDGTPNSDGSLDDWDILYNGGGSSLSFSGINVDPISVSTFTKGGSKDTNDITRWEHTDSSVPDKDEILHAFASSYAIDNQICVFFGADRYSNGGDAAIGVWFFQNNVQLLENGKFDGQHSDGDLLIIGNFGSVQNVEVYKWVQGNLILETNGGKCQFGQNQTVCAITNDAPTPSPWNYTSKSGSVNIFPVESFIEGGILLNELFDGQDLPCFSSFLVVTRSASSVNAQLKDFALNSFKLCGLSMDVVCHTGTINSARTNVEYDYTITVRNTGFGNLYKLNVTNNGNLLYNQEVLSARSNVTIQKSFNSLQNSPAVGHVVAAVFTGQNFDNTIDVVDNDTTCPHVPLVPGLSTELQCNGVTIDQENEQLVYTYNGKVINTGFGEIQLGEIAVNSSNIVDMFPIQSLQPDEELSVQGELESINPIINMDLYAGGVDFRNNHISSEVTTNTCPLVDVNSSLNITKSCSSHLVNEDNKLVVKVDVSGKVCNTGDIKLEDVSLVDNYELVSTEINNYQKLNQGECRDYNHSYYPNQNTPQFTDTIMVQGNAILGLGITNANVTAQCSLCP